MMEEKSVSPTPGSKSKKMNLFANIVFILAIVSLLGYQYYDKIHKEYIYNALALTFGESNTVEYGTKAVDTVSFVENVENGTIVDYTKELDTTNVGVVRLRYEVEKENVTKEFVYEVEVVDTKLPEIAFHKDTIYVYVGNNYNVRNNIKSVTDEIDGNLNYVTEVPTDNIGYYTVNTNYNYKATGTYQVEVVAVDKNGNESKAKYSIKVINKPQPKPTYNGKASVDTSSVVNAARSLLGSRYVYGGTNPATGFDCSGFVHYVYSLFGKNLGTTTHAILRNGYAVSRENMQPGDIIVWSTVSNNSPTHVSIYVGGNTMIHAANPRKGVISTSVTDWERYGGGHIVSIRRV